MKSTYLTYFYLFIVAFDTKIILFTVWPKILRCLQEDEAADIKKKSGLLLINHLSN